MSSDFFVFCVLPRIYGKFCHGKTVDNSKKYTNFGKLIFWNKFTKIFTKNACKDIPGYEKI